MKWLGRRMIGFTWVLAVAMTAVGVSFAAAAERAICIVCQVKHGEAEPEDVKATRTYEGVTYSFCSDRCAKEFDASPASFVPSSYPHPAPELTVTDLTGKPVEWETLRGKVVLLDFWATWCAPCRKSMPELQALHQRYAEQGFMVLGVSIDDAKSRKKVQSYVTSKKITYPIALDSEKSPTWERFKVKAVPAAFLVDAKGQVVARWNGITDAAEVERKVQELLPKMD